MADSVERLLVRIDATTDLLRRELKAADTAVMQSASIVEAAQARMNKSWAGANKYVSQHQTELKLLGAAAVGATALAVNSIIKYSDSYQRLQGQLKQVTSSQDELNRVYDSTKRIASDTGQTLESTITLYARMSRATEEMGISEKERLRITETINKALIVSGSSAQESAGALRQLSQALASGVLRGEEFNSMAENAPRLMQGLAQSLGVTQGELRAMSKEGELTSEKIIAALSGMGGQIDEEFSRMPMTVERAMNRISIAVQDAVGKADMSPMIGAIEEFEKVISDPSIVKGLTDIASGIVSVSVNSAQFIAALGGMTKATFEWLASQASGFDPSELVAYGEELERLKAKLDLMEKDGTGNSYLADDLREKIAEMETVYNLQVELINNVSEAREREAKAEQAASEVSKAAGEQKKKTSETNLRLGKLVVGMTDEEVKAYKKLEKSQETSRKASEKLASAEQKRVEKIKSTIGALDRQLTAIGMNERAQVIYNATMDAAEYAHGEEIAAIVDKTVALYDQQQAIEATGEETKRAADAAEEAAERSAQAAADAMQPWNDALQDMAANIDQEFSKAWTDAFSGAEDGFGAFADNMKQALFNLLGNMAHMAFTRPIVMEISAVLGGLATEAASAASTAIGGGPTGAIGQTGLSSVSGWLMAPYTNPATLQPMVAGDGGASLASGAASVNWANVGAGLGGGILGGLAGNQVYGQTSGVGQSLGGMGGAALGAQYGSAMGPWGVAIGAFLGAFGGGYIESLMGNDDGHNRGRAEFNLGTGEINTRGSGKTFDQENVDAAGQLTSQLKLLSEAIGGSALQGTVTVGNRKGIEYGGQEYGSDTEAFFNQAFRDIIENATSLNQAMKDLALAFEGTTEETAAYIMAMANMAEAVQSNPVEQAMADVVTSMDNASGGIIGAYYKQIDALKTLIAEYDGSAGATVELNEALVISRTNAYQLAVAIIEMSSAISDMLGDQAKYFAEAVMTEEQLRAARAAQRDDLISQLRTATDPQQVQELVNQFATVNRQLFDSLSEEQQLAQVNTFTNMTNEVDAIAQSILGTALTDLKVSQDDINRQMMAAVTGAAGALQSAANELGGHVTTFGEYVAQLVSRGINININSAGGAEVVA